MQLRASRRVNISDIAEAAGVSVGSVSSVLNNRHLERRISEETAQKIRETVVRMGYIPNISARRLRCDTNAKGNVLIALVTSYEAPIPLLNHFVSAVRQEIELAENFHRAYRFSLLVEMYHGGRLMEVPGLLTGDHFYAAIILNTLPADDLFLARPHLPYPVVLVNREIPGYVSVLEDASAGSRAAELLLRRRVSRLAVLHGSPLTQVTGRRVRSFERRSKGLNGHPVWIIQAERLDEDAGYEAMNRFFKSEGRAFDGLYAISDALALGAYRSIKEHGFRVPRDISVIGVGDHEMSSFFDPPLSCVGVSHRELAAEAARLLFRQLFEQDCSENVYVPFSETIRGSLTATGL